MAIEFLREMVGEIFLFGFLLALHEIPKGIHTPKVIDKFALVQETFSRVSHFQLGIPVSY